MRPGMSLKVMLILCLVCENTSSVFPDPEYDGTLCPMDPVVCTDTYEDFLCKLESKPEANRSLGFAIQTNGSRFFPVNKKDITVFNDSLIGYRHYFDPYDEVVKFKCYYWADDETWGEIKDSLGVGYTSISDIYIKPEKVKDFNCVVKNYDESMNCSWNYGKEYRGKVENVSFQFQWRIPTISGCWNSCPSLNIDAGYCYWNSTSVGDFSLKFIDIRLTVTQYCNMSVTSYFTLDTYDHVKPNPVESLSGAPVNSTCINVTWNTAIAGIYNVNATSKWGDLNTTEEQSNKIRMFCNLQEDTEYTFSVKVKPISKGYWSDIKTIASKTYSDVPGASPEVGGYAWDPKDCQEKKTRSVCVFWKSVSKEDENGNMKGLQVFIRPVDGSGPSKNQSLPEDFTYNCHEELSCDQNYQFIIHARNDIGSSKLGAKLTIISTELGLEQPTFRVERDPNITSQVTVKWQYPQTLNPSNFTLVWCRKSGGSCATNELIQWKTVSANKTMYTWNMTYPDDFMYGVSATTPQGQSGLHWESCIYTQNISPSKAPQSVAVTVGAEDNTLVVTWNKLTCEPGQPYITYYNIHYCELDNMYCQNASVNATETLLVLKDLSEGVNHSVAVQGVTMNGLSGPWSRAAYGIPVYKSITQEKNVGIAVGAIAVFVATVGVVFAIRLCKKRVCKKFEQARDVKLPEDPEFDNLGPQVLFTKGYSGLRISTRSNKRQYSGDSGYEPVTPEVDEGDRMEKLMVIRPDGYAMAAMQNGNCNMFSSTQSINSLHLTEDTNSFIDDMQDHTSQPGTSPVNNVVNTVHETRIIESTEDETTKIFKPKTDISVNTKISKKDSVIVEGCNKATLAVSKEREHAVNSSKTKNDSVTEVNMSPPITNNDLFLAHSVNAGKQHSVISESLQKTTKHSMLMQDNVETPSQGIAISGICHLDTIPHPVMDSGCSHNIFEHNSDIHDQTAEENSCSDVKCSISHNNRKTVQTQDTCNDTLLPTAAYVSNGCSVDSTCPQDETNTSAVVRSFLNSGPMFSSLTALPVGAITASFATKSLAEAPTFTAPKPIEPFSVPRLNPIPTPSSIVFSQGHQFGYTTSSGEDESKILYTSKDRPHVNSISSGSFSRMQDANGQGYVTAPNNPQTPTLSQIKINPVKIS